MAIGPVTAPGRTLGRPGGVLDPPGLGLVRAEQVGLGGGGAYYTPRISQADPTLWFVSCDMGGLYRSTDTGGSWELLDTREVLGGSQSDTGLGFPVACDPGDADRLFAYFEVAREPLLRHSTTKGDSWQTVTMPPDHPLTLLLIDPAPSPGDPSRHRVFAASSSGLWWSDNDGYSWTACGGAIGGAPVNLRVVDDPAQPGGFLYYLATSSGLYSSTNQGASWAAFSPAPTSVATIASFAAASDAGRQVHVVLYLVGDGGQPWRLERSGQTWGQWTEFGAAGALQVSCPERDTATVYWTTAADAPVYVSTARGDNPEPSLEVSGDHVQSPSTGGWVDLELNWDFGGPAHEFTVVCSNGGDVGLFASIGAIYRLSGGSWEQAYGVHRGSGTPAQGDAWRSNGASVTSTWRYAVDQSDMVHRWLCQTDVGLAESHDSGSSWTLRPLANPNLTSSGNDVPYNTIYDIAFGAPGEFWAAASSLHDVPANPAGVLCDLAVADSSAPGGTRTVSILGSGGVVAGTVGSNRNTSYGDASDGLPKMFVARDYQRPEDGGIDAVPPVVSIVADGNGRLYCSLLGVGVYRRDAGQTAWQACSAQPGSSANRNVYRLSWRDGGTADGTVYCVVTGKQDVNNAWAFGTSGVFASDDGGLTWADLTSSIDPAPTYVRGFDLTPDGQTMLVCTGAAAGAPAAVYRSGDGGTSWTPTLDYQAINASHSQTAARAQWPDFSSVRIDPANPQRVFLATQTHGIWYSIDGGVTGSWSELDVDIGPSLSGIHAPVTLPFSAYTDVDIVPSDRPGTIEMYATTFGAGAYLVVARQPGL